MTMDKFTTDDDEQWAREQGVPSFDQPFIQKYLQGRDALIAQEKKQRSGSLVIKNIPSSCRIPLTLLP